MISIGLICIITIFFHVIASISRCIKKKETKVSTNK